MGHGYSMLGFVVIVILYAVIGLMAAAGTIFIIRKILGPQGRADLLRDVPHHDRRVLLGLCGLLRSGDGVAVGNGCGRGVYRDRLAGRAPACRPDRRIFLARAVGPAARTSGAWSLLRVRAGPADRDPARLRILLCSLRLLHGGVFLCATRRVECRVEGGATVSVAKWVWLAIGSLAKTFAAIRAQDIETLPVARS